MVEKVQKTKEREDKVKEFDLTFLERMLIRNIYPVKREYAADKLREKIMTKLIDDDEMKLRKITPELKCAECGRIIVSEPPLKCPKCKSEMQPTGKIRWISKDDEGKPLSDNKVIGLGEIAWHTIKKTLKELNEAEDLDPAYHSLYEKFVLDGKVSKEISKELAKEPVKETEPK